MILSLRLYKEFGWAKTISIVFGSTIKQFFVMGASRRRKRAGFGKDLTPPRLKRANDQEGSSLCISCGLCEVVCPTQAIHIEVDNKIQFPKSLKTGPAPKRFDIQNDLCVRCSLCVDACPVKALSACGSET